MAGELVLVTGGTGFIGNHVVKAFLENVIPNFVNYKLMFSRALVFVLRFAIKIKAMN